MDIYEDRAEWQMHDHETYELYPLDWPENVFGEELPEDAEIDSDDNYAFIEDSSELNEDDI